MHNCTPWASSAMETTKETKGSLGDEDDARTSDTCIMQRKHVIPHSTMKNTGNIIVCCNNTHQGEPRTSKQTCACASDLDDASCVSYFSNLVFIRPSSL